MEDEKKAKEEAAHIELTDLLDMNTQPNTSNNDMSLLGGSFIGQMDTKSSTDKKGKGLEKIDKVYSEMKNKNKKLKKEKEALKQENETLRSIFAEFMVEFKQDKKHEKEFHKLTISEV